MFPEKDVPAVPSPADQIEQEEAVIPEGAETVEQPDVPDAAAGTQQQIEAVDETGVPYKNRAMEWKRKTEELSSSLPQIIEQKFKELSTTLTQQPQKPQYTIADLEAFRLQNPDQAPWVEQEKSKLMIQQLSSQMDEKLKQVETVKENQVKRQQAENYVASTYPELFVKDGAGRIMGWDQSNPLTGEISRLLNDPRIANQPDGLQFAADVAFARYTKSQQIPKLQKSLKTSKSQVKNLERKVMTEGAGRVPVVPKTAFSKAQERLAQTGSPRDAVTALGEYFKMTGVIKEE